MNESAALINERLGIVIFDEKFANGLKLIKYTKKQIKYFCIDDLIDEKGNQTKALKDIVKNILSEGENKK